MRGTRTLAVCLLAVPLWVWLCGRVAVSSKSHDFLSFYTGARLAAQGRFGALYDAQVQSAVQHALAPGDGPLIPYIRPPFYALLLAPLGWLPFDAAFAVWMTLLAAAVAACWLWAWRRFGPDGLVYAVLFYPLAVSVGNTQDAALLLCVLIAAYLLAERERDVPAGAVLALGLVKFHLALLWAPAMILTRRWRMLGGYAAAACSRPRFPFC